MKNSIKNNPYKILIIGFIITILILSVDAFVDYFIFKEGISFTQSVLHPEPVELWMRSIIVILIGSFSIYVHKTVSKLENYASYDHLTGIYNRRVFYQFLNYEIQRSKRQGSDLSLIMFDIDNFKVMNDEGGHHEGDRIIRNICYVISSIIRSNDLFCRWAGDEFMILSSDENADDILILAEKVRFAIENEYNTYKYSVTISVGGSSLTRLDSEETLISRVDKALYKAKKNGRNRVEFL